MPSMLIFSRVKENLELLHGAPPGAWAEYHKSGYMQTDIFTRWFEKFIEFSHATPANPVLLLLDGHATHIRNLKVIELAKSNGVQVLCFPPHCTHKMQPLDVGFNGPLNINFGREVSKFQRQGNRVILKNLFSIFGKAFLESAKMDTAINAFRRCGIYPFNSEIFPDSEFAASKGAITSHSSQSRSQESEERIEGYKDTIRGLINSNREPPSRKALPSTQTHGSTESQSSTSAHSATTEHQKQSPYQVENCKLLHSDNIQKL
ncbi:hypothetical protein TSAR_009432 [Trichomalopsis sarcophagae]|uniref:DDE-1 domain-containing protein n=1 Tax=Trichomalopsis sarcophagae TaxID=543379 RepID=A0A232ELA5_9HYME|nr:hypothetical protein TSAR_009432 [Trichomalopsis sarcophagae]